MEDFVPDRVDDEGSGDKDETCFDRPEELENQSDDHEVSESEQLVISKGIQQLARVVALVEAANEMLIEALPLVEDASAGSLLGLHDTIDSQLKIPVFDYFNDGVDPPTMQGLKLKIEQNSADSSSVDFSLISLKGTYDTVSGDIRYDLKANVSRTGLLRLNTTALDQAGLTLSETTTTFYRRKNPSNENLCFLYIIIYCPI